MRFRFKTQDYQHTAVQAITKVFSGQPFVEGLKYKFDTGVNKNDYQYIKAFDDFDEGYENAQIILDDEQLLENIQDIQVNSNINRDDKLHNHLGRCVLDIEMETGTGKTYVYIKSIFELNIKYGWSKFIIIVPSVAIREGVKKSFEMTDEHFMEIYKKKARYFIYNSANLTHLESFSSSTDIQVMIINVQAFNARGADARRISMVLDDFQSRKPIDVIAKNRPILILDEPQKMEGEATKESLKAFNPLFCMNFSATHKKKNNLIYVLDAVDAYNKRLVKKIEVKGLEIKNRTGTESYVYLSEIPLDEKMKPRAKIEFEVKLKDGRIKRDTKILKVEDNLYYESNQLEQYKQGYIIDDIEGITKTVTFRNGIKMYSGEIRGNVSESDTRRIQIRETIISHFEKECVLFRKGIKVLSLFFIDEVAKYRDYDKDDEKGEYARIFEEEYELIRSRYITLSDKNYTDYLKNIETKNTHKGYFSIDKKTNKIVNSQLKRKETDSDDISAYDLILKDKERLLSFSEDTRFIFSHSALREGWDNPNVFQICALKQSENIISRRQEVGRGLRICVNNIGERMDKTTTNINFHEINKLTVIATDSYQNFVSKLQAEYHESIYKRPTKLSKDYFLGKVIIADQGDEDHAKIQIDDQTAQDIYFYVASNQYADIKGNITETYRSDIANSTLRPLPKELHHYSESIHNLIQGVFSEKTIEIEDALKTKADAPTLNDNFYKKEFQTLWNEINKQYAYQVEFESAELISKAIKHIDNELFVSEQRYILTTGEQKRQLSADELKRGETFNIRTKDPLSIQAAVSNIKYDLIGKITIGTKLTRKTITCILKGISPKTFDMFKTNPEEFITKTITLINEQKATMIIDHINYSETGMIYDSDIFTAGACRADISKIIKTEKHITDYVVTDGIAENSTEKKFALDLETASDVVVYAKLPKSGFSIPTPVGEYTPDWAIAFKTGSVKHIYFIAETKGSMSSMQIRPIEKAKIICAERLFNNLSNGKVRYSVATDYQTLLDVMKK